MTTPEKINRKENDMATEMVKGRQEDLTKMLPVDAWLRGLTLLLVEPRDDADPVYLIGSHGVIQTWDYIPSIGEVDDACKNLKEAR